MSTMQREHLLRAVNLVVPAIAIGLMIYYKVCDTSCSSLKGTLLGLDLVAVGISAMTALLAIAVVPRSLSIEPVAWLRTLILSGGLGGEAVLVRFQVIKGVYCPYCLGFGICLLALFAANVPRMDRRVALCACLAGVAVFALFFNGSVLPLYE